ncbi:MAG: iron-sulfur cluster biosynthesis family protein [Catalinimonas sp.]
MTAPFVPIHISDRALHEIRHIRDHKNIPADYALRVGVRGGGGCGGFQYLIGFDHAKESDQTYHFGDLRVLIEKRHVMYLVDTQIDFEDGQEARGFTFQKGA